MTVYAHGVTITVRRHVALACLLPWIALGQKALWALEYSNWPGYANAAGR